VLNSPVVPSCIAVGFNMSYSFFFFFQAEDGIRDLYVTGVQTCALPIYRRSENRSGGRQHGYAQAEGLQSQQHGTAAAVERSRGRSEERRVGKECRSRWWPYQ